MIMGILGGLAVVAGIVIALIKSRGNSSSVSSIR